MDDDGAGACRLPLEQDQLRLYGIPRSSAEIPAGDDRVTDRHGDRCVDATHAKRVEAELGWRASCEGAPRGTKRLRNEPRAVNVQIEHERVTVETFPGDLVQVHSLVDGVVAASARSRPTGKPYPIGPRASSIMPRRRPGAR